MEKQTFPGGQRHLLGPSEKSVRKKNARASQGFKYIRGNRINQSRERERGWKKGSGVRWKAAHPLGIDSSAVVFVAVGGKLGKKFISHSWKSVPEVAGMEEGFWVDGEKGETMEANKRHVNQNGNKSIFKCGKCKRMVEFGGVCV